MKVSKLIDELQRLEKEHGFDIEVKVRVDEFMNVIKTKNIVGVQEFKAEKENFIMIE